MTAIAAVFAPGGNASALGVTQMLEAASHRGACPPATWRSGPAVLGWRASAGRQGIARRPFAAGPNDTAIVFDGRLDNADDLRRALAAGPEAADAALALAAYAKWSDDAAAHLLGDFAFAVWDGPRRRLFCARDALGQRSLFFGSAGGATLVASEPQQILAYPGFPAVMNEGIVAEYLTARPASADDTIWNGISRLRPAHTLLVSESALRRQRFWEFDLDAQIEYRRDEEYAEHFMSVFRAAIECRTRDASEVGIFLSGGVDSSAIAGVAESMARERGAGPLRAYSLTFPGLAVDESRYIDAVVERWRLPSVRMAGRSATREEIERDVTRYRDLPTYPHGRVLDPLRRRAAAEVDVALSGSGGDDWFTGSPVHTADLLRDGRWLQAARQYRHDVALPGRGYTRAGLLRTAIAPLLPPPARAILRPLVGTRPPVHAWIRPEFAERVALRERLRWPPLRRARTLVQAEIHRTTNSLMQMIGDELEDRATSAAGLDQRDPFNDRRVVEFGFALPERQRWSAGRTKVVLRRAAAPVLPAMVLERDDKAEFSSTFVEALTVLGGRPFFETLQTAAAGWVDAAVTRRMYDEMIGLYTQGRESYIPLVLALWSVAAVELWLNHQHKERSQ